MPTVHHASPKLLKQLGVSPLARRNKDAAEILDFVRLPAQPTQYLDSSGRSMSSGSVCRLSGSEATMRLRNDESPSVSYSGSCILSSESDGPTAKSRHDGDMGDAKPPEEENTNEEKNVYVKLSSCDHFSVHIC